MGAGGGRRSAWSATASSSDGERRFTEHLARLHRRTAGVLLGIGDDAAVLAPRPEPLVVACDPVIEGVHFDDSASPARIAHKAIHRNLSDLAAMGAEPRFLVVSMVLPRGTSPERRDALSRGLERAAAQAGCAVVGGDVATVPAGPLTLTVTAFGYLALPDGGARSEARILRRSDARVGDQLHVTGPLGGSLLGRHLRFRARIAEGRWLASCDAVGGVCDISDGLALDLLTLCRASEVPGAVLYADRIPVHRDARRSASDGSGRTPLEHALGDGEDHELLFTVRSGVTPAWDSGPVSAAGTVSIGELTGRRGLWLRSADGGEVRLERDLGFQHGV